MNVTVPQAKSVKSNSKKMIIIVLIGFVLLIGIAIVVFFLTRDVKDSNSSNSEVSLLPVNTCPEELQMKAQPTAIYKGKAVDMSKEVYDWVQINCDFSTAEDNKPPELMNLGIANTAFDKYDEMTGRAGAFIFDKNALKSNSPINKILIEFGSTKNETDGGVIFPEIIYSQVDADTDVISMVEGTIFKVDYQVDSNDYSVEIRYSTNWMILHDHVRDLQIVTGDKIKAGDILGKVALNRDNTTGFTEIAIKQGDGRVSSTDYCPTDFLSGSVKLNLAAKLQTLMSEWETYYGDSTIYNEILQKAPACLEKTLRN